MFAGCARENVVVFAKRDGNSLAVDLARAWDQNSLAKPGAIAEHEIGATKNRFDSFDRLLENELHPDSTGQVINAVVYPDQFFYQPLVEHAVDNQGKTVPTFQMRNVGVPPGRKVIKDGDLVAVVKELLCQMRANESGAASDKRATRCGCLPWKRHS